jgi:hypothetical protein
MSRRAARLCPTPSKKPYPTEDEAVEAGAHIEQAMDHGHRKGRPFYVYRCDCRRFHLTHHIASREGGFNRRAAPQ